MLRSGDPRCVAGIKSNSFKLKMLENFSFPEDGIERGNGIREKSRVINTLLNDPEALDTERENSRKIRDKLSGVSSSVGSECIVNNNAE